MATKYNPIRWTIHHAAAEFGVNDKTLSRRLKAAGIAAAADGRFSSKDILAAIISGLGGDYGRERTRLTAAEADVKELQREKLRGALLEAEVVARAWEIIVTTIRQKALGLATKLESRLMLSEGQRRLVEAEVDEILDELSKSPTYNEEPSGADGLVEPDAQPSEEASASHGE